MKLEQYQPKRFAKEYIKCGNLRQYPMFAATALGVKPCYDEWVPVKHYKEFLRMCNKYGLHAESLIAFEPPTDKNNIIGGKNITTTHFEGRRLNERERGEIHIIISKSKDTAIEAKKWGWYSVAINNRCVNKPFVDHLRYGKTLGYPDCCIQSFLKFNNWKLYSHPYESYRRTQRISGKAQGSYYCNNFLMDNFYFLIHNIPCSYNCKETIRQATEIEKEIAGVEPEYIEEAVEMLKKPLLVFGERHFIIFDGINISGGLKYSDSLYIDNPGRPEDTIDFYNDVEKGNILRISKDKITIFREDKLIKEVQKNEDWFQMSFK